MAGILLKLTIVKKVRGLSPLPPSPFVVIVKVGVGGGGVGGLLANF